METLTATFMYMILLRLALAHQGPPGAAVTEPEAWHATCSVVDDWSHGTILMQRHSDTFVRSAPTTVDASWAGASQARVSLAQHLVADLTTRSLLGLVRRGIGALSAYLAMSLIVAGAITFLYWSRGAQLICKVLTYLAALSTLKLVIKGIYVDYMFTFPRLISATHFACGAIAAGAVLLFRQKSSGRPFPVPTMREFWMKLVPISLGFAISIGAENMSLIFSSAAFVEMVGATSPISTVGVILVLGLPFDKRLIGPTLLVVAGCALSTVGELHFSGIGMALCVLAIIARSVKSTVQQEVLTGPTKAKFDPWALLFWMCTPSFVLMMLWSLVTEGLEPYAFLAAKSTFRIGIFLVVSASCLNACILNLANLFVTKDLGAVGIQLVAQTKAVLTVLGAVAIFDESVTKLQAFAFAGVLSGVYLFSRTEEVIKAEKAESATETVSLPAGILKAGEGHDHTSQPLANPEVSTRS